MQEGEADRSGSGTGLVSIALALDLSERHDGERKVCITATDLGESLNPPLASYAASPGGQGNGSKDGQGFAAQVTHSPLLP